MAEKAKVYFTSYRVTPDTPVLSKFRKVILEAGFDKLDFKDKIVAIKMHFGEPGNMAYLRPNYARELAAMIRERGGKPFVTDSCTLYVGRRTNAVDYLQGAVENGYTYETVGCPVIIADGLKGTDEVTVPLHLPYLEKAHVAAALMEADFVISLSHFKGHPMGGFGGTIKNLGMGTGSRAGKMQMHCSFKPDHVAKDACVENCGEVDKCIRLCEAGAIYRGENGRCAFDTEKCTGCNKCVGFCNHNAIVAADWMERADSSQVLGSRMAEFAYAVCHGRQEFHINLIVDVSPWCDCCGFNDVPIVPNIGMLASFDAVAIDKASLDLVNAAPVMENSELGEKLGAHIHEPHDAFHTLHPNALYDYQLIHGVEIGLGTDQYELVEV